MTAGALADEIIKRRVNRLESLGQVYPRKNAILSDIGDCERQMVYGVLNWQSKPPAGPDLQARFEVGKEFEKQVVRELMDMGFDFQQSQAPVAIKGRGGETIATGKIDGFIRWEGELVPVEIKSMQPNMFNGIKSIDDFQKKPWLRRYTRQLMMYMFGHSKEWGLFIVGDLLGHWKMLPLALDYGEAESILQKLERVSEAIKAKRYPDRIIYDQAQCGKCPFAAICLQDVVNTEAEILNSPELEAEIERHEELKPVAKEFDEIHDRIKSTFANTEKAIIGDRWIVQNIPSQRTAYELPDEAKEEIEEIKKQYAVLKPMKRLVIERLGEK
ncbi:MAG: hypothetical protein EKK55_17280 [Rhodocyclaceae bacterium]|nr:MAG: hypothetical protein EKK55_17280 [Rhodocyclaceae bacterium]